MVHFCYIDESGTPSIPGNTSHYVLCGFSIPVDSWKKCHIQINKIKKKYGLSDAEIHSGWIKRAYFEQSRVEGLEEMNFEERRSAVIKERKTEIFRVTKSKDTKGLKQLKKNYKNTEAYIHLTYNERIAFLQEVADAIGKWKFARVFAECIDKVHFDPTRTSVTTDEQAFEQIVSRFELYLEHSAKQGEMNYGMLIHDNNDTESKKLTALMKKFYVRGTLWTDIKHIIETPFFVNSELTGMIQIADLCALAIRRYFENGETDLLDRIKTRIHTFKGKYVGVRHFTSEGCACEFCSNLNSKKA